VRAERGLEDVRPQVPLQRLGEGAELRLEVESIQRPASRLIVQRDHVRRARVVVQQRALAEVVAGPEDHVVGPRADAARDAARVHDEEVLADVVPVQDVLALIVPVQPRDARELLDVAVVQALEELHAPEPANVAES